MYFRIFAVIIFSLSFGGQALACSCAPWSGYVSEFAENYVSVWAVPTEANVNIGNLGKPAGGVTYKLEILEGFERIIQTKMNVDSNVADGGSCGVQLILGSPQFISANRYGVQKYGTSSCTPRPPYTALKRYLETGEDSYIPEWSKCHSWPKDQVGFPPIFNEDLEVCTVWKDADYIDGYYGAADRRKYLKIWWDNVEAAEPKKNQHWWPFNKD